jgi:uncharacterized damage-inducible protein DinB
MALNEALLLEFDQEMANTRKILERVPDDKLDWRPHEKSMTVGKLASHLAWFPGWTTGIFQKESVDVAPPGAPQLQLSVANSRKEILEMFDRDLPKARAAIAQASDADLSQMWTLLKGGKTIFSLPRIAALRGMVMNHMIHHRAQLGIYLRLNNIPLPAIYGPSADEGKE